MKKRQGNYLLQACPECSSSLFRILLCYDGSHFKMVCNKCWRFGGILSLDENTAVLLKDELRRHKEDYQTVSDYFG